MIPATSPISQPIEQKTRWQQLWRQAITDPKALLAALDLPSDALNISLQAAAQFPLRVPHGFVARMRKGDRNDPLLRQVLPLVDELRKAPGFSLDAVGDAAAGRGSGVIQKYQGRALLIATGSCAVHCRYCFRRHFPYSEETAAANQWQQALALISNDRSINEVILSGGDPWSLSTEKLQLLTDQLQALPHVRRLRIHTRLPIVLPERVDSELLHWLSRLNLQKIVVVHANHGNEINAQVTHALNNLKSTNSTLLNQTVLLAGVNDSANTLAALSEKLFESGTLPYYLHQLDRVVGAAHFEVSDEKAIAIHGQLLKLLPGFLVPKLVREVAGELSKQPLKRKTESGKRVKRKIFAANR